MKELHPEDIRQLQSLGISEEKFRSDLHALSVGFPPQSLDRSCTINDGIRRLDESQLVHYGAIFDRAASAGRVSRFVPASGAATRMFQHVLALLNQHARITARVLAESTDDAVATAQLVNRIEQLAVYEALQANLVADGLSWQDYYRTDDVAPLLERLLTRKGLGLVSRPKALIPFHRYEDHSRTALEEHVVEAADIAVDRHGVCRLHITSSEEHVPAFRETISRMNLDYRTKGIHLDISLSTQKTSTDTPAVFDNLEPVRDDGGRMVLRPAGHGALLANLNDIAGDIVFIKNIDNVVHDRLKGETIRYKKALGGLLVALQERVFEYIHSLDEGADESLLAQIEAFCRKELGAVPHQAQTAASRKDALKRLLDRPLRVCGMVKNQGEPGGGPFWVISPGGGVTLQIVEKSQVDMADPEQRRRFESSTHFNPVDLVCAMRDYRGHPFDLSLFVDPASGFVASKSYHGRPIRALELPGLWNGSMAHWNTVFVEVPQITFNPVKTINDLLRPEHQPS